jgi:hypothetical protein
MVLLSSWHVLPIAIFLSLSTGCLTACLTAGASTVAIAALSTTGKRGIGMQREKTRR